MFGREVVNAVCRRPGQLSAAVGVGQIFSLSPSPSLVFGFVHK